jgi:hypothetical protein
MQKQARVKPGARIAKRKQRQSDAPLQTFWQRCVSLVMNNDLKDANLSLCPDPQTIAASMQSTYAKAFARNKKRKTPDWMLLSNAETSHEAPEATEVQATNEVQENAQDVETELAVEEEVHDTDEGETTMVCDFCEQRRKTSSYGEDTFEEMHLCEECAGSVRVDVDGTTHNAVL